MIVPIVEDCLARTAGKRLAREGDLVVSRRLPRDIPGAQRIVAHEDPGCGFRAKIAVEAVLIHVERAGRVLRVSFAEGLG